MFEFDMCAVKLIVIKSKRFLVFIFVFGSDFHHSCFEVLKFLKLFLCLKNSLLRAILEA